MDLLSLFAISLVIMAASFFATASGFGFALVATPLLSLFVSPKEAILLIILLGCVLRVINTFKVWGTFDWHVVLAGTLGSLVGTIPGSLILKVFKISELQIFLGVVLLAATILMGREVYFEVRNKPLGRFCAGFFSGFFGSSTSVSGPPLMLYFLNEDMPKEKVRANMIMIFSLGGFIMLLGSYFAGTLSLVQDVWLLVYLVPALLIGTYIGEKVFYKINQHLFRRLALLIVCCGAVMMLVSGVQDLW